MNIITQKRLKELLDYNSETGIFTWKTGRGLKAKFGSEAGCLADGYISIRIKYKSYRAHRLAWLFVHGYWPSEIDHVNQIKDDNRIKNLREVTHRKNLRNAKLSAKNTSGVCGVYWDKISKKWRAQIRVDYKQRNLGRYEDWFDAVCARKSSDNKHLFHQNHGRRQ